MSRQDKLIPVPEHEDPCSRDEIAMLEVNLRLRLDQVADLEAELLRVQARRRPVIPKQLRELARKIYEARRMRDRLMDDALFGEPAWDMMLALYHMPALGKTLTVSGLCYCSGVPQTTALRWQNSMKDEGLIEIGPMEYDGRMKFVRLSESGRTLLERYLIRLSNSEVANSSEMPPID